MQIEKLLLSLIVLICFVFVSQAQRAYTIGKKFGGGIVFVVSPDGRHGLIAETQDQGTCNWNEAFSLISNPANHSAPGKTFTDWRLPNKEELSKLFKQRKIVGGFTNYYYWSSTENSNDKGHIWNKTLTSGAEMSNAKCALKYVRAVRSF